MSYTRTHEATVTFNVVLGEFGGSGSSDAFAFVGLDDPLHDLDDRYCVREQLVAEVWGLVDPA